MIPSTREDSPVSAFPSLLFCPGKDGEEATFVVPASAPHIGAGVRGSHVGPTSSPSPTTDETSALSKREHPRILAGYAQGSLWLPGFLLALSCLPVVLHRMPLANSCRKPFFLCKFFLCIPGPAFSVGQGAPGQQTGGIFALYVLFCRKHYRNLGSLGAPKKHDASASPVITFLPYGLLSASEHSSAPHPKYTRILSQVEEVRARTFLKTQEGNPRHRKGALLLRQL